ncbi:unnamed protein product [Paramecium octaurelia]|uniref:Uncharacterized protein n=1 Tax=Paramecium octaurelia TaxID=43137 RepID=A0A8S1X0Z8_PAROT|nr:unnamed protein product [Paramecium octaurelia]
MKLNKSEVLQSNNSKENYCIMMDRITIKMSFQLKQ